MSQLAYLRQQRLEDFRRAYYRQNGVPADSALEASETALNYRRPLAIHQLHANAVERYADARRRPLTICGERSSDCD